MSTAPSEVSNALSVFRRVASFMGVALLALGVCYVRNADAFLNPQFFAEDALVFHGGANDAGWGSLLVPYAGYLHCFPRLVALFAQLLVSPEWHPACYNYASALAGALLSAYIFAKDGFSLRGALIGLGVFLIPQGTDMYASLTNAHWVGAIFLIAILVYGPSTNPWGFGLECLGLLVAALSSPFCIPLCLLAIVGIFVRRKQEGAAGFGGKPYLQAGLLLFAAVIQAYMLHKNPQSAENHPPAQSTWLQIYGVRFTAQTFFPGNFWPSAKWGQQLLGCLAIALPFAAVFLAKSARPRMLLLLVAFALGVLATGLRMNAARDHLMPLENGPRYFFFVRVISAWMLIELCFERRSLVRWSAVLALCFMCFASGRSFFARPLPDLKWAEQAKKIREGAPAQIPVNPVPWVYHYSGKHTGH